MIEENTFRVKVPDINNADFNSWKQDFLQYGAKGVWRENVLWDPKKEPLIFNLSAEKSPEIPGVPFEDEIMGGLRIGPKLPRLMKKLDNKSLTDEQRAEIHWEISQLYNNARENNAWWTGPTNKRSTEPIEIGVPRNAIDAGLAESVDRPKTVDEKMAEYPKIPYIAPLDVPVIVPPVEKPSDSDPDPTEVTGNWLQRQLRRLKKGFQEFKAFTERDFDGATLYAIFGGVAGTSSVAVGALAAEFVSTLVLPTVLGGPLGLLAGIGTALFINKEVFGRLVKRVSEIHAESDAEKYRAQGITESEIRERTQADTKGRITSFAIADILAKIVGGSALAQSIAEFKGGRDLAAGTLGVKAEGSTHISGHSDGVVSETLKAPHLPEIPDYPKVTVDSDTMFTQVMADNYPGKVYSPQYIEMLKANRDTLVEMFRTQYPDGLPFQSPYQGGSKITIPIEQAIYNLDQVISRGYPNPELLKGVDYANALTDMFNAVPSVKAGTDLVIPPLVTK